MPKRSLPRTINDGKCIVTARWPEIETIYRVYQELLSRIVVAIGVGTSSLASLVAHPLTSVTQPSRICGECDKVRSGSHCHFGPHGALPAYGVSCIPGLPIEVKTSREMPETP
jgi:hypothetical protein